jgi:hypothetical protein
MWRIDIETVQTERWNDPHVPTHFTVPVISGGISEIHLLGLPKSALLQFCHRCSHLMPVEAWVMGRCTCWMEELSRVSKKDPSQTGLGGQLTCSDESVLYQIPTFRLFTIRQTMMTLSGPADWRPRLVSSGTEMRRWTLWWRFPSFGDVTVSSRVMMGCETSSWVAANCSKAEVRQTAFLLLLYRPVVVGPTFLTYPCSEFTWSIRNAYTFSCGIESAPKLPVGGFCCLKDDHGPCWT